MKRPRVRIGTLMLVVVIAALGAALIAERWRSARLLAEVQLGRAKAALSAAQHRRAAEQVAAFAGALQQAEAAEANADGAKPR